MTPVALSARQVHLAADSARLQAISACADFGHSLSCLKRSREKYTSTFDRASAPRNIR
jgi:hypothetical protein